jgi:hypothetical protein
MAEKRSIFEEVSETQKPAATPGGVTGGRGRAKAWGRRAMRLWLQALFVLVVIMIAVGGLTRLTDSGCRSPNGRPCRARSRRCRPRIGRRSSRPIARSPNTSCRTGA